MIADLKDSKRRTTSLSLLYTTGCPIRPKFLLLPCPYTHRYQSGDGEGPDGGSDIYLTDFD